MGWSNLWRGFTCVSRLPNIAAAVPVIRYFPIFQFVTFAPLHIIGRKFNSPNAAIGGSAYPRRFFGLSECLER